MSLQFCFLYRLGFGLMAVMIHRIFVPRTLCPFSRPHKVSWKWISLFVSSRYFTLSNDERKRPQYTAVITFIHCETRFQKKFLKILPLERIASWNKERVNDVTLSGPRPLTGCADSCSLCAKWAGLKSVSFLFLLLQLAVTIKMSWVIWYVKTETI